MRVDHFSTQVSGGAGSGARRLHESLRSLGVDSRLWYWRPGRPRPPASRRIVLWGPGPWPARLARRSVGRLRRHRIKAYLRRQRAGARPGLELFSSPRVGWETPFDRARFTGHVAHLHWVAGLIDWESFFGTLPAGHPVLWTLRDMNPFTGGCHFSGGCERHTLGCGHCPQLGTPGPDDASSSFLRLKTSALRSVNLHVVAPSRWMLEQARRSVILARAAGFHRIPIGVETDVFVPYDRDTARDALELPRDGLVVALGSDSLANPRKGFSLACDAIQRAGGGGRAITVVCFGSDAPDGDVFAEPLDVRWMGYVRDPALQARIYSAADCFVLPSLEDNLPKTGLESLSCATPVVGFDVGGIPDYVRPGETGALVAAGDVDALADALSALLDRTHERQEMGRRGRRMILSEFTAQGQAEAYLRLYREVVGGAERD